MKEVVSLDLEPFYNIDLPKKLKDEKSREVWEVHKFSQKSLQCYQGNR